MHETYESDQSGGDHAPPDDRRSIDDESRAQADGATVPYPAPAGESPGTPHLRPAADDALGNLSGRTPW
jgi:hypothetical protein